MKGAELDFFGEDAGGGVWRVGAGEEGEGYVGLSGCCHLSQMRGRCSCVLFWMLVCLFFGGEELQDYGLSHAGTE